MDGRENGMARDALVQARQELERRNALSLKNGFETDWCEPRVRQYYHPDGIRGRQVYQSYTDEELLDVLLAVMDPTGRKPRLDRLHHIFKLYLKRRFRDAAQANARARARRKTLALREKWPPDWPEHVSAKAMYVWLTEQGRTVTEEDRKVIGEICKKAGQTGRPPELSAPECLYLKKFCSVKKALEIMRIPPLSKSELCSMSRYWDERRRERT